MDKFSKCLLKMFLGYIIVCLVMMVLFKTIFMLSYVPTGSMEGTIQTGDFVISTRYDIRATDLDRYDILVFVPPDEPSETYIKRLIGLPGETIKISNGNVYADGAILDNSFVNGTMNQIGDGIYNVPEGCYFFLGDNRNDSRDSRFWVEKFVPLNNIQAKVKLIL